MRNRFYISVSLVVRMGMGLIVFVLMARGLGPQQFGLTAAVVAYASVAALLIDFGLSWKTLRDISETPGQGAALLSSSLSVKALLAAGVLAIGSVAVLALPIDGPSKLAALLFGAGIIIASFGDLSLTAFRAVGRYSSETWITLWTSAIYLLLVGPVAILHGGIQWVATAFLVSRVLYAIVAFNGAVKLFPGQRMEVRSLRGTLLTMRDAQSWAVDNGLGYLNGQIDTLVVVGLLSLSSAGVYQAGSRFVQAALGFSAIFSSIHIPAIAAHGKADEVSVSEKRMMGEFVGVGCLFGVAFWLGGPFITRYLLGPHYTDVNQLWPGFGAFLFARYLAASLGAGLTAFSAPRIRVGGQVMGMATLAIGFMFLPRFGVVAIPLIMAAGSIVTMLFYLVGRVWLARRCYRSTAPGSRYEHPPT
jgi:O-antigen/teichoic acid export membrane protein